MFSRLRNRCLLAVALIASTFTASTNAIELDTYLPENTGSVVVLNFKQLFNSKMIKMMGVGTIKQALEAQEGVGDVLDNLGLDITKDIDSLIMAGPSGGDDDEGLFILRGRFDVEKFKKTAQKAIKDNADAISEKVLKDGKGGKHTVYQVEIEQLGMPLYVNIANKNVILAAASKDYLLDGLSVKSDRKVKLKNTEFEKRLKSLKANQSMAFIVDGKGISDGVKNAGVALPGQLADILKAIKYISGGMTVDDGFKLGLDLTTGSKEDATKLRQQVLQGLNFAKAFLGFAAQQNPQMQIAIDFINSLKTTTKGNDVQIRGGFSAEDLQKLGPRDQ